MSEKRVRKPAIRKNRIKPESEKIEQPENNTISQPITGAQQEQSDKRFQQEQSDKRFQKIKLLIDDRERAVSIHSAEWKDIPHEISRITTADYVVVNETKSAVIAVIERKSLEDFAASIKDGRSENVNKLIEFRAKTGARIVYLIEGEYSPRLDKEYAHIPYKTIESAIFHLIARDNICVLRSADTLDTAKILARFVKSMSTLDCEHNAITGADEQTAIDQGALNELLKQKHVKSDIDIVRELWAAFNGISISSADEYIKVWSLADIICARVVREDIANHRTSSGRQINKKVASTLMGLDKGTETRILACIPMLSRNSANYILLRRSLAELIQMPVEEMQQVAITDKKKLGVKIATNIITYMNYKGL